MKLEIYKKPNPLKVFDKINKLKKLLKPIKVENNDEFIQKLLEKPMEINHLLSEGYSLKDHEYISISCDIKCNIPIEFSAQVGNGSNCWITGEKPNGESLYDTSDKSGLIEILENLELPNKIIFTEIELSQKIGNSSSKFKYKLSEQN
ncbi:hypothetical protein PXC01_05795 [Maribacter sp. M208]|uniref:hypothetical protein n=1 Tax=Maribacter huludaoensis TaxID=3030010 RepID=UPI0023EC39BB|nr:hypothetical protein [Maribacter huludaoensis]MDF4221092.1 hypothetical protein [Maribacter huludaoensis]